MAAKKLRPCELEKIYAKVQRNMQFNYIENSTIFPEPDYSPEGTLYDSNCIQFWHPITNSMVPGIKPIYLISSQGNIYNRRRHKVLPVAREMIGGFEEAYKVSLARVGTEVGTTEYVHDLIMKAYRPLKNGPMHDPQIKVAYIDDDYENLTPSNLSWTTQSYIHKRDLSKKKRFKAVDDHYMTQLNKNEGARIQALYNGGMNPIQIHDLMLDYYPGLQYKTVYDCCMDTYNTDNKVNYG